VGAKSKHLRLTESTSGYKTGPFEKLEANRWNRRVGNGDESAYGSQGAEVGVVCADCGDLVHCRFSATVYARTSGIQIYRPDRLCQCIS
jgi:hypothetical protein